LFSSVYPAATVVSSIAKDLPIENQRSLAGFRDQVKRDLQTGSGHWVDRQ
jgi:hypothetical protein